MPKTLAVATVDRLLHHAHVLLIARTQAHTVARRLPAAEHVALPVWSSEGTVSSAPGCATASAAKQLRGGV
jgi:hypothetical protein